MPGIKKPWHSIEDDVLVAILGSSENGLDDHSVEEKRKSFGLNELEEAKKTSIIEIFFRQFKSLVVAALLLAALLSFFMEEYTDVAVILAVLIINALIGTFHEYRAEKALAALKKMSATSARVLRNGVQAKIPASELVPGDIVLLEVGDRVPADCRLLEASNLAVDESMFTGESVPVSKSACILPPETELPDRKNMAFKDTIVTSGKAKAIVVETGMRTEIGKIAGKLQSEEAGPTPLQVRLSTFMKSLGIAVIIGMVFVIIAGRFVAKFDLEDMIRVAIAQAVSFIPEGLPIVITIVLSIGVASMAARKAIARRISAVETLGCVTAICTDKTGTLTKNEMTVSEIYLGGRTIKVSGLGYSPKGKLSCNGKPISCSNDPALLRIMEIATLCNDSALQKQNGSFIPVGDPTEVALLVAAKKAGFGNESISQQKRVGEVQFDPEKKFMATFNLKAGSIFANVKGAPEKILSMCSYAMIGDKPVLLTKSMKEKIIEANHKMASKSLRVLGFAYKKVNKAKESELSGMTFVGLIGMIDPPREEAKHAIKACKESGIKTIMITGDHPITALGIARELGMLGKNSLYLTGAELSSLSDEEFEKIAEDVVVYARMSSEHKLRIVNALKKKGHIVAMTGDGVNDALAIKKADIGIAMGQSGTEVTKESSDMVLADDNFATIVAAIEEGRWAYSNIQKVISYMIATSLGEVFFLFAILFSGLFLPQSLPLALLPIHILWVNLVTDGVCVVTLAMEPKEKGLISQKPRDPKEPLITQKMSEFIILTAAIMAIGTFVVFLSYQEENDLKHARTVAFTTLSFFQLFSALNARSSQSLFKIGLFSNKYLIAAIVVSIFLQSGAIYIHPISQLMQTAPLSLKDWAVVLLASSTLLFVFEAKKLLDSMQGRAEKFKP